MRRASTHALLSPVEQVRLQGEFIEAAEIDRAFKRNGGSIFWAIDSNIIDFLIDPVSRAFPTTEDRQTGYSAIFADDPEGPAKILANALADHIVETLSQTAPLLIPTPIDRQVFKLAQRLSREGAANADELAGADNADRATKLLEDLSRADDTDVDADGTAAELLRLALLQKVTEKLRRLQHLFETERIVIAAKVRESLPNPLPLAMASDDGHGSRTVMQIIRESLWRDYLGLLTPNSRDVTVEEKVTALALIQKWNDRLERRASLLPNIREARINFLTGHTSLVDSSIIYQPHSDRERHRELAEFSQKHFRHPRGLLAELGLLRPAAETAEDGGHFFDLWAHWNPAARPQDQAELTGEIKERWAGFIRKAVLTYEVPREKDDLERWQIDSIAAVEAWRDTRKEKIESAIAAFWEQCFYFATQGLVRFGDAAAENPNARDAPPIYFETWTKASGLIALMLNWISPAEFELEKYIEGIAELNCEFGAEAERDGKYAYYLAHSVLFAARGNWAIAAKVAAFARRWTRAEARWPGEANGREAMYLQAFCLRHAAQRLSDLEALPALVGKAQAIAAREREAAEEEGWPPHDCVELRFESELLAIEISRWLFERFSATVSDAAAERARLVDIIASSRDVLVRVENHYAAVALQGRDGVKGPHRASVLFRLRIRIVVNLLGLSVYDRERVFDQSFQEELLDKAAEIKRVFKERHSAQHRRCFSDYGTLILSCVKAVASRSERERSEARRYILDETADAHRRKYEIFPYDSGKSGRIAWIRTVTLS